ncbi:MAG: hypothetical protein FWB84_04160 [Candidatus Bathyarchaeota archaeon]|uniref:hypothetical protein n=1 Tax=Candidatus Bathycorpusculum sp. TaxID=2994959 RepID=UPI002823B503|nr:hypothetical protein [Candidatus Termiticorpusculum sp.]MCL2257031.1 hypothetical protein [Candidatus Termiticorpusculum sp.]MCL2292843.1 hypothetical protein [Candidatus Termiticorpusculum sp.]
MDFSLWDVNGFMVALLLSFIVIFLYHAKQTKNNVFYMLSGYCCSVACAFFMGYLGQPVLFILIMATTNIIGVIVMHSKLMQTIADSHVKATEVIDVSGLFVFESFFPQSLW